MKRIPAVPSAVRFTDYSTVCILPTNCFIFTVVVCLMKFMTHNKNHEEFKKKYRERRKGIEKNKIRDRFLKKSVRPKQKI